MLGAVTLALVCVAGPPSAQALTLEFRIYRGSEDVTARTRVTLHRAGDRDRPVAVIKAADAHTVKVPAGIYDAQAIEEHGGRVLNIRWAERLVVMPYPDEGGHHLEVINFTTGYGALQIRGPDSGSSFEEVALYAANERAQPAATAGGSGRPILFVVQAGQYDIQVRRRSGASWHTNIEVPLDRTRLWIVP